MNNQTISNAELIRNAVEARYSEAATRSQDGGGCCGTGCGCSDPITSELYTGEDTAQVPEGAVRASLGCANPTAVAELRTGEVVLDLGSGGGIDVLLSAKRVGPTGFAYGLDMTDAMLALAERNLAESGLQNVKFLKGQIEQIPLPDQTVDVILSNCVINLSADKPQTLREAFRVLKRGGRVALADVVVDGDLPADIRADMEAFVGCVAGALELSEYRSILESVGFEDIEITPYRRYSIADVERSVGLPVSVKSLSDAERKQYDGKVFGAIIRANKAGTAHGD